MESLIEEFKRKMHLEGKSERTVEVYSNSVKEFSRWFYESYGNVEFKKLYRENILEYKSYLKNIKKSSHSGNNLCPKSINSKLSALICFNELMEPDNIVVSKRDLIKIQAEIVSPTSITLEYAVDAEYIEKNPYRIKVNKKKFISSSKKPSAKEVFQAGEKEMLIDEMERRLKNNPSNTAPLAVMLDFELGTRKGEILAICKADIVGNRIHIHRQLVEEFDTSDLNHIKSKGFHVVDYTKSEDGDRWLPLTDKAKKIIKRIEIANREYSHQYKDFLFVKDGKCLTPDAVDAQIKRGCEYIGIPVKTMHKIRKTYASTLLHNGVNLSIVKDMLGHADESTTLKHYIYNIEDSTETDNKVLNALAPQNYAKSDQSDQNIIPFRKLKRAENLEKSTLSAL